MVRGTSFVCFLLWSALAGAAQEDVDIQPDRIECWPVDEFLILHSAFVPPEEVQSAKFYFRSAAYPDYYFVDLAVSAGEGEAVAPKAKPDTKEVTFYLEVVTPSFGAVRTLEKTVPVASASECKRRNPAAMFFTGQNPNIAVTPARSGAPAIPPGFQIEGISTTSSEGGGISGKTVGILAGVGGGAAAALVVAGTGSTTTGGGATSTASGAGGPTTTTTTTTSSGSPPTSSSSTTTAATTTAASTTVASTSSTTTSNPTTSVAPTADMAVTKTGAASAVVGKSFNYSVTVDNLGPATANGVRVTDGWTAGLASFVASSPAVCKSVSGNQVVCDLGSMTSAASPITIRLTLLAAKAGTLVNSASVSLTSPADPNSSNNSATAATRISPLKDGPPEETDVSYKSSIAVEPRDGSVRAQILVNGSSFQATDNSGEFSYTARVHDGVNRIETRILLPDRSSGSWRFDFGATADLVAGSVRVESGRVLSQDGLSIVFALGRGAPPPRFTFEVGAGRRSGSR
jgi:Domain of unknown function DUF11